MPRSLHKCSVTSCHRQIGRELLMCPSHWRLVPQELQREVYATWKASDFRGWFDAQKRATRAVDERIAAVTEA